MYDIKLDNIDTVIFDFDETLVRSIESVCHVQHLVFGGELPDVKGCRKWNLEDVIPNITPRKVESLFATKDFFDILLPYNDMVNAMKWFKSKDKRIVLLSLGSSMNLHYKSKYVRDNFGDIVDYHIYAGSDGSLSMDKGLFNFKALGYHAVMIDDNASNLDSMKKCVDYRILAKLYTQDECEWNKGWKGLEVSGGQQLINMFR